MNHELELIVSLTVAIMVALAGGLVAHWLRQSPIVGYLLAGMAIGPFTPGFVADREQIAVLAEIGVLFLMFALGIEFSLKELARIKGPAIIGTCIQVLLILLAGTLLGRILGWPLARSVFFGGIISISSTMVILKNLMNRGEIASNHGRLLLGMLIVQDLVVVLLILLLPKLSGSGEGAAVDLLWIAFKAVPFIAVTLFLGARRTIALRRTVFIDRCGASAGHGFGECIVGIIARVGRVHGRLDVDRNRVRSSHHGRNGADARPVRHAIFRLGRNADRRALYLRQFARRHRHGAVHYAVESLIDELSVVAISFRAKNAGVCFSGHDFDWRI